MKKSFILNVSKILADVLTADYAHIDSVTLAITKFDRSVSVELTFFVSSDNIIKAGGHSANDHYPCLKIFEFDLRSVNDENIANVLNKIKALVAVINPNTTIFDLKKFEYASNNINPLKIK